MVEALGARAFAAARTMVGVPFRAQGRDPRCGLDCVGLVWAAYAAVDTISWDGEFHRSDIGWRAVGRSTY